MSGTARRGRPSKAAEILHAACGVFGRDGFSRASVDALAAGAGVSTRTLYNNFPGGKEELFRAVVVWSSHRVRDEQVARIRRRLDPAHPPRPDGLEFEMLALAREQIALMSEFHEHFALVRHINAEAGHIPAEVLDAWRDAGPRAAAAELASGMAAFAGAGLLDVHGDAARAAAHFTALTSTDIMHRSYWGVFPLPEDEQDRVVADGVRAFLRAYGGPGGG